MEIQRINAGVCNCYIIRDKGAVLVDCGVPGRAKTFARGFAAMGIAPTDIEALIITHCHWDHVGCAKELKAMTGAEIIVHENEKELLEQGILAIPPGATRWGKLLGGLLSGWSRKFPVTPCKIDTVVQAETVSLATFGIRGKIVFTPGHSPGSLSVVLDSGEAFVGDMAMNGLPLTLGPGLPIFAEDIPALKSSWRKLIDVGAQKIHPAHGAPFPIEKLLAKVYS